MIIKTKLTLEMKALLKDVAKTAILHNSNVGISAPALLILLEENEQYEGVIKKAKE